MQSPSADSADSADSNPNQDVNQDANKLVVCVNMTGSASSSLTSKATIQLNSTAVVGEIDETILVALGLHPSNKCCLKLDYCMFSRNDVHPNTLISEHEIRVMHWLNDMTQSQWAQYILIASGNGVKVFENSCLPLFLRTLGFRHLDCEIGEATSYAHVGIVKLAPKKEGKEEYWASEPFYESISCHDIDYTVQLVLEPWHRG